jgi:hypothetical protein
MLPAKILRKADVFVERRWNVGGREGRWPDPGPKRVSTFYLSLSGFEDCNVDTRVFRVSLFFCTS